MEELIIRINGECKIKCVVFSTYTLYFTLSFYSTPDNIELHIMLPTCHKVGHLQKSISYKVSFGFLL